MNTLAEGKDFLRENFEKGVNCPCCGQFVKQYSRKLTSSMAYALILLVKADMGDWVHVENFLKDADVPSSIRGDVSKLKYWDLLEPQTGLRADGSTRVGFYKVTPKAKQFVANKIRVPGHVKLFNNKFLGFTEDDTNIEEALGNEFNYRELMSVKQGTLL